jgi:hypothetical protein
VIGTKPRTIPDNRGSTIIIENKYKQIGFQNNYLK